MYISDKQPGAAADLGATLRKLEVMFKGWLQTSLMGG